jgi:hypothetical protein
VRIREPSAHNVNYLPDRKAMRTAVAAITKRASATSSARREHGRGDTCPEKALSSQCTLWMPIGHFSAKSSETSTNGSDRSESSWLLLGRERPEVRIAAVEHDDDNPSQPQENFDLNV